MAFCNGGHRAFTIMTSLARGAWEIQQMGKALFLLYRYPG